MTTNPLIVSPKKELLSCLIDWALHKTTKDEQRSSAIADVCVEARWGSWVQVAVLMTPGMHCQNLNLHVARSISRVKFPTPAKHSFTKVMQIAIGHGTLAWGSSPVSHHKVSSMETFKALVKNSRPHLRSSATTHSLIDNKEALHNAKVVLHNIKFSLSEGPVKIDTELVKKMKSNDIIISC